MFGHIPPNMIMLISSPSVPFSEPAATLLVFQQPTEDIQVKVQDVAAGCILQEPMETLSLMITLRYTQQPKAIGNLMSTKTC